jgi:hypothetical protein
MQNYYLKEKNPLCCGNTKTISVCENPYCAEVCETGIIYRNAPQSLISCESSNISTSTVTKYNQVPMRYGGYHPDSGEYNYTYPSYGQVAPCTLQLQIESLPSQQFCTDCESNEGFYKGYYQYDSWIFPLCKDGKRTTSCGIQNAIAYLGFDEEDEFNFAENSKRDVYLYLDLNMANYGFNQLKQLPEQFMPTAISGDGTVGGIPPYGFNHESSNTFLNYARYNVTNQNDNILALRKKTKVGDITWTNTAPSGYYNSNVYCSGWYNLEIDTYVSGIGLCNGQDSILKISSKNNYFYDYLDFERTIDFSTNNGHNYGCMSACLTNDVDEYVWPTGNVNHVNTPFVRSLIKEIGGFGQSSIYQNYYVACHDNYKNKIDTFVEGGVTYKQFKKPQVVQVEITGVSGISGCEHLNAVHNLSLSPKYQYSLLTNDSSESENQGDLLGSITTKYYTKRLENYDYAPSGYNRIDCPECRYGLICGSYQNNNTGASGLLWQNLCISEIRISDFDFPLNNLSGNVILDIMYDTYGSSPYRHHNPYNRSDLDLNTKRETSYSDVQIYNLEGSYYGLPQPILIRYSGQFFHNDVTEFGFLNNDLTLRPIYVNNQRLLNKINLYDATIKIKGNNDTITSYPCMPKKMDLLCEGGRLPDSFLVNVPANMFTPGYLLDEMAKVGNLFPSPLFYYGYYDYNPTDGNLPKISDTPFSYLNGFGLTNQAIPYYHPCSGCIDTNLIDGYVHCNDEINGYSFPEGDYLLNRVNYIPSTGVLNCISETFCGHGYTDYESYMYENPDNLNSYSCHWKYLLLIFGKHNTDGKTYNRIDDTNYYNNVSGQVAVQLALGFPSKNASSPFNGSVYNDTSVLTYDCDNPAGYTGCNRINWIPFSGHMSTEVFHGFPNGTNRLTFSYGNCDTVTNVKGFTNIPVSISGTREMTYIASISLANYFPDGLFHDIRCHEVLDSYTDNTILYRTTNPIHSGHPVIDLSKNITAQGIYT